MEVPAAGEPRIRQLAEDLHMHVPAGVHNRDKSGACLDESAREEAAGTQFTGTVSFAEVGFFLAQIKSAAGLV